jgi:hypothetical protein
MVDEDSQQGALDCCGLLGQTRLRLQGQLPIALRSRKVKVIIQYRRKEIDNIFDFTISI